MICKAPARVGPFPANPPLAMRTITTLLIANLALLSATNGQHLSENIFKHPDDAPVTARFKSPCTPDCLARAPISLSASYSGLYPGSKYDVTLIVQQGLDVVHMTSQQVFKTEREEPALYFTIQLNFVIPPIRQTGLFSVGTYVYDLSAGLNEEDRLLTKFIVNIAISREILSALSIAPELYDNEDSDETSEERRDVGIAHSLPSCPSVSLLCSSSADAMTAALLYADKTIENLRAELAARDDEISARSVARGL